jgi:hypothetical protein
MSRPYVAGCRCNLCPSCTHRLKMQKGAMKRRIQEYYAARGVKASLTKAIKRLEGK